MKEEKQQQNREKMQEQASVQDRKQEQLIGRGLYKKVRISVRMLDCLILVGMAAIVLVILFGIRHGGYTITFNAKGGSDVAPVICEYGDRLTLPARPEREGYTFAGWYLDENYMYPVEEPYQVEGSTELYARWEPAS